MREIKFRCWNPTNNRMIKIGDKSNDTALWIDENGFYVLDHFAGFPQPIADHLDGLILMQYVGLKDKNGVEIYEGDIVLEWGWSEANDYDSLYPLDKKHVVSLDNFRMWLKGESFGYEGEELINPENCEVIGNIHEHSQLMETK